MEKHLLIAKLTNRAFKLLDWDKFDYMTLYNLIAKSIKS